MKIEAVKPDSNTPETAGHILIINKEKKTIEVQVFTNTNEVKAGNNRTQGRSVEQAASVALSGLNGESMGGLTEEHCFILAEIAHDKNWIDNLKSYNYEVVDESHADYSKYAINGVVRADKGHIFVINNSYHHNAVELEVIPASNTIQIGNKRVKRESLKDAASAVLSNEIVVPMTDEQRFILGEIANEDDWIGSLRSYNYDVAEVVHHSCYRDLVNQSRGDVGGACFGVLSKVYSSEGERQQKMILEIANGYSMEKRQCHSIIRVYDVQGTMFEVKTETIAKSIPELDALKDTIELTPQAREVVEKICNKDLFFTENWIGAITDDFTSVVKLA